MPFANNITFLDVFYVIGNYSGLLTACGGSQWFFCSGLCCPGGGSVTIGPGLEVGQGGRSGILSLCCVISRCDVVSSCDPCGWSISTTSVFAYCITRHEP